MYSRGGDGEIGGVVAEDPPGRGAHETDLAIGDRHHGVEPVLKQSPRSVFRGGTMRVLRSAMVSGEGTQPADYRQHHRQRHHQRRVRPGSPQSQRG